MCFKTNLFKKNIINYKHCPELGVTGCHVLQDDAADEFHSSSVLFYACIVREEKVSLPQCC